MLFTQKKRGNERLETVNLFLSLNICQIFTFILLLNSILLTTVNAVSPSSVDGVGEEQERSSGPPRQQHQRMKIFSRVRAEDDDGMGDEVAEMQEEDRPIISPPRMQAVELLLRKYKQMSRELEDNKEKMRIANPRALWSEDFERRASELCGTSASLECGKRVLSIIEGQEGELSVHVKCDLREDFLKCIGTEKKDCLELAKRAVLPELPPKEAIKVEQSKLWKVLWTAGGCVLANY